MTQFGRALATLNIEILCANSSQAKGRIERANRTLQDRLVKELRLAGVSDMGAGNMFLPGFVKQFNEKFSVPAEKTENLHRKLNVQSARLAGILCLVRMFQNRTRQGSTECRHTVLRKYIVSSSMLSTSAMLKL